MTKDSNKPKALMFDVGGTLLDWRTGLIGELENWGANRKLEAPWPDFADRWRILGLKNTLNKKTDELPGGNIDGVHRSQLPRVFEEFELPCPPHDELDSLTLLWHRLPAWPDVTEQMARLRRRYFISTLTILSVSLVMACSRRNRIQWDAVISCEMMDAYKFHTETYQRGCELLGFHPGEVMMVAAHDLDLESAAKAGMKTAFVARPYEWGREDPERAPDHSDGQFRFDYLASGLEDLANQLTKGEL